MKIYDAALLSMAIGLTCSTVFLFASDYPATFVATPPPAPVEVSVPRSKDFIAVVVHGGSATCRPADAGSKDCRSHFVVPAEDAEGIVRIEATTRWREQITAEHTRNRTVNRRTIAVWVDLPTPDGGPSAGQSAALAGLLDRLKSLYGFPPERIFTHAAVDVETKCGDFARP